MHKTGTSSIQQSLHRNLKDPNFYYLVLDKIGNQSRALKTAFNENPEKYHLNVKYGKSSAQITEDASNIRSTLSQQLTNAKGKTSILSAEAIWLMSQNSNNELRQFLLNHVDEATAVGYVRTPKAFIESNFQQHIKGGSSQLNINSLMPKFSKLIELEDCYGRDNTRFWKFDPTLFHKQDIVLDFCKNIDLNFPEADSIRNNEGLSLYAVSLLFCYRKFGPGYGQGPTAIKENVRLIKRLEKLNGPKLKFHSSFVKTAIKKQEMEINWIETRTESCFQEDIYKDDETAIRCEEDLLQLSEGSTQWLAKQLGPEFENQWTPKMNHQSIASWVHQLRMNA